PRLAAAFNNLGMALVVKGRPNEAVQPYTDSLSLEPHDARVQRNLAQCLATLGRLDEAVIHYAAAVPLSPRDEEVRVELAKGLGLQGRVNDAIAECDEALRQKPGYDPAMQVLNTLRSLRETKRP